MRNAWFAIALVAALVAGCGGGGSENTAAMTTPGAATPQPHAMAAARVSPAQAADQLMDLAEGAFPQFFPGHKTTQAFQGFVFRFYPETGMYVGVVVTASAGYQLGAVYVMGGPFGNAPTYVGPSTAFATTTGDSSASANLTAAQQAELALLPAGIEVDWTNRSCSAYTQDGLVCLRIPVPPTLLTGLNTWAGSHVDVILSTDHLPINNTTTTPVCLLLTDCEKTPGFIAGMHPVAMDAANYVVVPFYPSLQDPQNLPLVITLFDAQAATMCDQGLLTGTMDTCSNPRAVEQVLAAQEIGGSASVGGKTVFDPTGTFNDFATGYFYFRNTPGNPSAYAYAFSGAIAITTTALSGTLAASHISDGTSANVPDKVTIDVTGVPNTSAPPASSKYTVSSPDAFDITYKISVNGTVAVTCLGKMMRIYPNDTGPITVGNPAAGGADVPATAYLIMDSANDSNITCTTPAGYSDTNSRLSLYRL
jgi:hypothetical protein